MGRTQLARRQHFVSLIEAKKKEVTVTPPEKKEERKTKKNKLLK